MPKNLCVHWAQKCFKLVLGAAAVVGENYLLLISIMNTTI
jgi:hypothetical protein